MIKTNVLLLCLLFASLYLHAATYPATPFVSKAKHEYIPIPEEDMKYYAQQPYAEHNNSSPMLMGPDLPPDPGQEDIPEVPVGGTLPLVLFALGFLLLRTKTKDKRIKTKDGLSVC